MQEVTRNTGSTACTQPVLVNFVHCKGSDVGIAERDVEHSSIA